MSELTPLEIQKFLFKLEETFDLEIAIRALQEILGVSESDLINIYMGDLENA